MTRVGPALSRSARGFPGGPGSTRTRKARDRRRCDVSKFASVAGTSKFSSERTCRPVDLRDTLRPVIVCLCEGVSERKVRRAIERGAVTMDAIGDACRAGVTCFGCHPELEDMLYEVTPVRIRVA